MLNRVFHVFFGQQFAISITKPYLHFKSKTFRMFQH